MKKKKKKTLIIGITGSIAAFKIPQIASDLNKEGLEIFSILTANGEKFVTRWTMEALTGNPCFSNMFYLKSQTPYPHIELSKGADLIVIAPATANFIAKAALGIADDLLSTTYLSCTCPKLIAPAMNEKMYLSKQTQANIEKLKKSGAVFLSVEKGRLACGDEGAGRMSPPDKIIRKIHSLLE